MKLDEWLPLRSLGGLRPKAWVCVAAGYSREELKSFLLSAGVGFTGAAVVGVQDLCLRIVGAKPDRVLGGLARQEVLRTLLAVPRISREMPELKRLRRQTSFFKKLDRSLQAGRLCFAHEEEQAVYGERLAARVGENPIRLEVESLARAYEAWLRGMELWDLPLLLRQATEKLQSGAVSPGLLPESLYLLSAQTPESLEQGFWDALSAHLVVHRPPASLESTLPPRSTWERWHSLDDAAESLAERLAELPSAAWREHTILIPDQPGIRRTIRRALDERGIPLTDPRDPTRIKSDEKVKWAMLPLEMVARGFERERVIAFLRTHWTPPELAKVVGEIQARGLRQGLEGFAGGMLAGVHSRLGELNATLGGKKRCEELGEAHLQYLREAQGQEHHWVIGFFERLWKDFAADMARVGLGNRRAPALYWLERLQMRLEEATPPVDRVKPREGVTLHRLGQAPLAAGQALWLFGLPPHWLSGEGSGDYWYSEREREVLSGEFAVRSGIQLREERKRGLAQWLSACRELYVLDSEYDFEGRERESVGHCLRELGFEIDPDRAAELEKQGFEEEAEKLRTRLIRCEEKGAHPRWLGSFSALRPIPPRQLQLPSLDVVGSRKELLATELDRYSRCGFMGLAGSRWRLKEAREPGAELWPEVKGNILHKAVRIMLEERKPAQAALQEAWELERPKGLLKGKRLAAYTQARLLAVLESFWEKEKEYQERAGTRVASLEGPELRIEYPEFTIKGIPDRVDEHPEGLFILDFKTSSQLPKGKDMVEQGYRLQLPFYALAAQKQLSKPTLGVQFVELNRKAGRNSGIFFKQYNGKEPGKLTHTRSRLSMLEGDPSEAWSKCEEHLVRHARDYLRGSFAAEPKKAEECRSCMYSDLCGYRRLGEEEPSAGAGE